jgi:hypothetical protein
MTDRQIRQILIILAIIMAALALGGVLVRLAAGAPVSDIFVPFGSP